MSDSNKSKTQLLAELTELRQEVARLRAVDARCLELEQANQSASDNLSSRQAEMALQESEQQYQQILDAITDFVLVKGPHSRLLWANKAFRDYYGMTNEQLRDIIDAPFNEPDYTQQYVKDDAYVFNSGTTLDIPEEPVTRYDGEIRLFHTVKSPIFNSEGQVVMTVGVSRDVTERKQVDEVLTKRAKELETVAQVGAAISTILETDKLLQEITDLTKERFDLYHVHIYLLDKAGLTLELAAGAGAVGRQMVTQAWRIPLDREDSLVARIARLRQGIIVNDVRQESGFLPNPLLPDTQSELAVPIIIGDQLLGVLDVQADLVNRFTGEDIHIQTTLASQIAVALQNASQYEQTRRRADRERLVNTITQKIQDTVTHEMALKTAIQELGQAFQARQTYIELLDSYTEAWKVYTAAPTASGYTYDLLQVSPIQPHETQIIADVEPAPLTVPLLAQGETIGRLVLNESQTLSEEVTEVMEAVAGRLVAHLENLRLSKQTEVALAEVSLLYETSRALAAATNLDESLRGILATLNQNEVALGADSVTLTTVDVDEQGQPEWNEIAAWWLADGREPPYPIGTRFPVKDVAIADLWMKDPGNPLFFSDIRTDEKLDDISRQWYLQAGTLASVLMPLTAAGRWVGLLSISWTEPHQFSERDQRVYRNLMRQFATMVDNQRLVQQTQVTLAEQQQIASLLDKRVRELNCLNELGREISETPAIPQLLQWITERIPIAMQHPHLCMVAVEYNDQLYGQPEAINMPTQIVNALRVGGEVVGRVYIAYSEKHDFLDEESALLGGIAIRLGGYIENRRFLSEMERLASIVENHPDFIGSGTLDGKALYVNPAGLKMMKLPLDHDVTKMSVVDFYPAEDAEMLMKTGIPVALKEGSWSAEANLLTADETTIPVEEIIGVNLSADKQPIGFSITMRDITERKQAETEREQLLTEVQAAYRHYVQREWAQFLDEHRHDGNWHIEHQQIESGQAEVSPDTKNSGSNGNLGAMLAKPISLRGQTIGSLNFEDIDPNRRWTAEEIALVETVSEQLALTVENLRLFGDTQQRAAREQLTREITDKMRASPDIDTIIKTGLTELAKALGVTRTYVKLTPNSEQVKMSKADIEQTRAQLKRYGHKR